MAQRDTRTEPEPEEERPKSPPAKKGKAAKGGAAKGKNFVFFCTFCFVFFKIEESVKHPTLCLPAILIILKWPAKRV